MEDDTFLCRKEGRSPESLFSGRTFVSLVCEVSVAWTTTELEPEESQVLTFSFKDNKYLMRQSP